MYSQILAPLSLVHCARVSNELGMLLAENAELRRTAAELALETAMLREILALGGPGEPPMQSSVAMR